MAVSRHDLRDRRLTADLRGASLDGALGVQDPGLSGFRRREGRAYLGSSDATWDRAAAAVLRWAVKTRSGFTVVDHDGAVPADPVRVGDRYWLIARIGFLRIHEPVEIVSVVDETSRKGFAYGTLEGHPVSGEEAFLVERREDGGVWFVNTSFTGPPSGRWRALYPAALCAQPIYRRRYLTSLRPPP